MKKDDSAYTTPASDPLVRNKLPEKFINGVLTQKKLKLIAWLSIFYMLLLIPATGTSIMNGVEPENTMYDISSKIFMFIDLILWIYLFSVFKVFLNLRFNYYAVDKFISILIVLSIILSIIALFIEQDAGEFGIVTMTYFALMVPYGIVTVIFAKNLLSISENHKYLKLFSWVNIVAGVCIASIVLFFLAIPLGLFSSLYMALIFFTAAKEISNSNTTSREF